MTCRDCKYEWTKVPNSGLWVYKHWWLEQYVLLQEDWLVGADAVARAANSTWGALDEYLVHIAQTYPMLSGYLIGPHMTIDS